MKRYFIEEVKYGYLEIGISSNRTVTIRVKEGDNSEWLTMADGEGFPDTYLLEEDRFEDFLNPDLDQDVFAALKEYIIYDFDGIELCDYSDILESVTENPDNPASPLIRYLAALIRCEKKEIDDLVKMGISRYADEIVLPEKSIKQIDKNYLIFPENVEKEFLYKMRYRLEADIDNMSLPDEFASDLKKRSRTTIQSIKDRCNDEEDYITWKKSYVPKE